MESEEEKAEPVYERNSISSYFKEVGQIPYLTEDEVKELAGRVKKGDLEARNKLVQRHLQVVISIAKSYPRQPALDFEDLIQEGNIGLIEAAERYEFQAESNFGAYASWWIHARIRTAIRKKADAVRIPDGVYYPQQKARNAAKDFKIKFGRDPSEEELAEFLGLSREKVGIILQQMRFTPDTKNIARLDGVIDSNGQHPIELHEIIPDRGQLTPEQLIQAKGELEQAGKRLRMIKRLVKLALTDKEASVFLMRFGLDDDSLELKSMNNIKKQLLLSMGVIKMTLFRTRPKIGKLLGVKQSGAWLEHEFERIQFLEKLIGERVRI